MNSLPFDDISFDWLWSANCVGYSRSEPLPLLKEVSRVIKSGGTVALLIYSSQMLLPGYPLLEARLNATSAGMAPFTAHRRPGSHYLCALGWFQELGFEEPMAKTYVYDIRASLSPEIREAAAALPYTKHPEGRHPRPKFGPSKSLSIGTRGDERLIFELKRRILKR